MHFQVLILFSHKYLAVCVLCLKCENQSPAALDLDTLSPFNFLNVGIYFPAFDWIGAFWSVPQMDLFQYLVSKLSGSTPPH